MVNILKQIACKITLNNAVSKFCMNVTSDDNFNAEREETISHLVSGNMKAAMKSCRRFLHNYWNKYYPISIGELKLQGVNDVSCHVAAMDDVLSEWLDGKEDVFNKKIEFLKGYVETYGDYRIPHVLLAWEYLRQNDYKESISWALAACALDERCMPSWQILKIAFLALRDAGRLEECLSEAQIKHLEPLGYDLRGKICPLAFDRIFVQSTGEVMCCCAPLVPVAIGNVFEDSNWRKIINSNAVKKIRESIIDGSYTYCNRLTCQEIRSIDSKTFLFAKNNTDMESYGDKLINGLKNDSINNYISNYTKNSVSTIGILNLGFDQTCNLHCPQCRKGFIHLDKDKKNKLDHLAKHIIPDMVLSSKKIIIANTGEPLASKYYRKVLKSISFPEHKHLESISIFTNGLLLNRNTWEEFSNIHPFNIGIAVSVDAMTKQTYEKVRPPGKWETLFENVIFISSLKKSGKIKYFEVEYVIQECNFKEIKKFAYWAIDDLNVTRVVFHRLINVGTYTDNEYKQRAVFNNSHPKYDEFLDILKDPIFVNGKIHFTDLAHCLQTAIERNHK